MPNPDSAMEVVLRRLHDQLKFDYTTTDMTLMRRVLWTFAAEAQREAEVRGRPVKIPGT